MKPLILLSNDDGVYAAGIRTLAAALSTFADVVVVAPLQEQSAKSHALTLAHPLRHRLIDGFHAVDGTPADAIYVGLFRRELLPRTPDLVVSGINHGYNLGSDTFYSGTVAAAREGALRNIPSIAFSLGSSSLGFDFDVCAPIAVGIVQRVLMTAKPAKTSLLNVNFPARHLRTALPDGTPNGIRATRLGVRRYEDEVDVRKDPRGHDYYWIGGPNAFHPQVNQLTGHDTSAGSDTEAVDAGFVSITPLGLDATEHDHMALATLAAGVSV